MKTKVCSRCKVEKLLSEFNKNKSKKDGLSTECKPCDRLMSREWFMNNRDKRKEAESLWRSKNRDRYNAMALMAQHKFRFGGNRDRVIERDEHKCVECGSLENLCVHHLDGMGWGFKKEDKNNSIENLATVCNSCHRRIHNEIR